VSEGNSSKGLHLARLRSKWVMRYLRLVRARPAS